MSDYDASMRRTYIGAELTLDQIWSLVDEMIEAHGDYLPQFQ